MQEKKYHHSLGANGMNEEIWKGRNLNNSRGFDYCDRIKPNHQPNHKQGNQSELREDYFYQIYAHIEDRFQ